MNPFNLFRRGSAPIARERLQILLAHERNARSQPDLLGVLREEISRSLAAMFPSIPTKCRSSWIAANRCRRSPSTLRFQTATPRFANTAGRRSTISAMAEHREGIKRWLDALHCIPHAKGRRR